MKTLLPILLLSFAACSHHDPAPTTPAPAPDPAVAAADPDDAAYDPSVPAVDPTLPSWSPRSCAAYHTAVLHVLACDAIEPTKRAAIKAQYDLDHARWQAMHDEPTGAITEVREGCKTMWQSLRTTYADAKCIPQAQPQALPTASLQ